MSNCVRRAESNPSGSGAGDKVATVVWQNIYRTRARGPVEHNAYIAERRSIHELAAIASPRRRDVGPPPNEDDGYAPSAYAWRRPERQRHADGVSQTQAVDTLELVGARHGISAARPAVSAIRATV